MTPGRRNPTQRRRWLEQVNRDDRFTPSESKVLTVLALRSNNELEPLKKHAPSVATVAAECRVSDKTVKRALSKAVDLGYLDKYQRKRWQPGRRGRIYAPSWLYFRLPMSQR